MMLSNSDQQSSGSLTRSKSTDALLRRNSSSFILSSSPLYLRAWLFLFLLCLQVFLFVVLRSISLPISRLYTDHCTLGRIYVYPLPSFFNRQLMEQCDSFNSWTSRCDALANNGFGPSAATQLSGIIPDELAPAWFWTDQFVSEIIFHQKMLKHRCRTTQPEEAKGFYIPFYAGLAVGKFLWSNYSYGAGDRDRHCQMMLRWVEGQEYYRRSGGWDHFMTMGRITWDFRRSKDQDWGSTCLYMTRMRNITRLLIERNPWDYFDVGIPYPTGFHPRSDYDVTTWQHNVRVRRRNSLFCFAGATRRTVKNDFRGLLLEQCRDAGSFCRAVNCGGSKCSNGTAAILESFLDSKFCLQPRGDSFTRRSILWEIILDVPLI